jgi:methionyl aminopeptidase
MVRLKSPQEIETLAEGGAILARIFDELAVRATVGTATTELDALARQLIEQAQAKASFLGYRTRGHPRFPAALCVSINEAVVHGLPSSRRLQDGDIVGLDLGIVYRGLYLDSARTVAVGSISSEAKQLLEVTRRALRLGIEAAELGKTTGDIGAAIEEYVEGKARLSDGRKFGVVRQLVGHGVGYAVHEEPAVPNFGKRGQGTKLVEGLVIAIEPMVTIGDPTVMTDERDEWTVKTQTGNLAAHEEHTVAITKEGPRILTKR